MRAIAGFFMLVWFGMLLYFWARTAGVFILDGHWIVGLFVTAGIGLGIRPGVQIAEMIGGGLEKDET